MMNICNNPDPRPIVYQYWNIGFQLYIVGPVLYRSVSFGYHSTHDEQYSPIDGFFLQIDCASLVLIHIMFIGKSWQIVKNAKNKNLKL